MERAAVTGSAAAPSRASWWAAWWEARCCWRPPCCCSGAGETAGAVPCAPPLLTAPGSALLSTVPLPCVRRHARELAHKVSLGASTDPGTSFGPPAKPDGAAPSVASHGTQASAAAAAAAGLMLGTRDTLSPSQSASAAVDGGAAGAPSLLSLLGQAERRLLARTDAAALEALVRSFARASTSREREEETSALTT